MQNNLTFGALDALCMRQAGGLTSNDIDILIRQNYINVKLMKLYRALDGLNDPWYNKSSVVTVSTTDQSYLKDSGQSGTITGLTVSSSTITLAGSTTFVAGQLLNITLVLKADGTLVNHCIARVITGGTTATATILSGSMITYVSATHHLTIIGISSYSATTIDMSGIYFKDIVRIYDDKYTATAGQKNRVFTPYKDAQFFGSLSVNPQKVYSVAWYQRGDTVELFVGSSAISLGTITMEYRGKPSLYTDATMGNYVDIPPEQNDILIDDVIASFLVDRKKSVPENIQNKINNWYASAEADKVKNMETVNK